LARIMLRARVRALFIPAQSTEHRAEQRVRVWQTNNKTSMKTACYNSGVT